MFKKLYHKKYHGWYRNAKKLFIFDLILLGLIILTAGTAVFFYFYGLPVTSKIDLTITTQATHINGANLPITISYQNNSDAILENVLLSVLLPNGFILDKNSDESPDKNTDESPNPENQNLDKNNSITIPDLAPGANANLTISGQFFSDIKNKNQIIASLSYRQQTRSVRETKSSVFHLANPEQNPEQNIFSLNIQPEQAIIFTQQQTKTKITLCDIDSEFDLPDTILKFTHKNLKTNKDIVLIKATQKQQCEIVEIKIEPQNDKNDETQLIAELIFENNGKPVTIAQTSAEIFIKNPKPNFSLTPKTKVFTPNTDIDFELKITNTADQRINNIGVFIQPENIWQENPNITYNAHPELRSITPNQTVTIPIVLKSKNITSPQTNEINIIPKIIFDFDALSEPEVKLEYAGEPIIMKLPAKPIILANARYFSPFGDQIGRGPIPPIVGQTTKYWVFINTQSQFSNTKDAVLKMQTAPNVIFTNKYSMTTGSIASPTEKNRIWYVGDLSTGRAEGFYIEVEFTPDQNQVGKHVNLIETIELSGKDVATGSDLQINHPKITSKLEQDTYAQDLATEVQALPHTPTSTL